MIPIVKFALSSMNYLFLEHCIHSIDVARNETVEGELEIFLSSLSLCNEIPEHEIMCNYLRDDIVRIIMEGPYLERLSPEELKLEIKDSIYIIMGTEHQRLEDFYNRCVDLAASQLEEKMNQNLREEAL